MPTLVILAKRSALVFSLKTKISIKTTLFYVPVSLKWGKTLLSPNKPPKSLDNLEGPFGNVGFWVGNIGYITAKIT